MKIKVINYKAGNAPSVVHAVRRLGLSAEYASSAGDLVGATHIILPGVGSARATLASLRELGLLSALENAALGKRAYFLGICVGLQVLFEHSEEDDTPCLGWLRGRVARFDPGEVRVPQMGWNHVTFLKDTPVPAAPGHFYFVNSYRALPEEPGVLWGQADYGGPFAAAVNRDNIYASQFHAEKSGPAGLRLLAGFLVLPEEGLQC